MKAREEILARAEGCRDEMAQCLQKLISFRSVSGEERDVVECIAGNMRELGYDEVRIDGLGNVIGRVGSGPRSIAMDAHIDVVDVGSRNNWTTEPFQGVLNDGVVYGRGACDMKGGMVALLYGAKIVKDLGLEGELSVYVTGTVMEEDCDGLCWQYILREQVIDPRPECVLIAEPTNLGIYRGHRGRMEIEITVPGISAHGSAPERGTNAIYRMAPIVQDIEALNERLHVDHFLGKGSVTISEIRSTSPSLCAVADSCTIHLDRRLTAGETEASALDELEALDSLRRARAVVKVLEYARPAYTGLVYPTRKYYPTWVLPEDHPALGRASAAYRDLFRDEPNIDKWTFSTNGVATMGMFGIPTLGFGPGDELHAHSPSEQIPVEHLVKAAAFYAGFVARMGMPQGGE